MTTALVSKLQLSYYETGEFSERRKRTLEETILLLKDLRWREHDGFIVVGLDGPSVTIEDGTGQYLKVGLYYYEKFSIYLLDRGNKLFMKIIDDLDNVSQYVEAFFEGKPIKKEFKKYYEWVWRKQRRFADQPFRYSFRTSRFFTIMLLPCLMLVVWTFLGLLAPDAIKFMFFLTLYALIMGANWFLFFNYYFFSRHQKLIISRGVDDFFFEEKGVRKQYSKENIKRIQITENTRYKSPVSEFCFYELYFNDGTVLKFTNLLIGRFTFDYKFPNHQIASRHRVIPRT